MDATANELEDIKIQSFPTIKYEHILILTENKQQHLCFVCRLFPKDSNEAIDFQGERTLEALAKFVDSNGAEAGRLAEEVSFDYFDCFLFQKSILISIF